MGSFFAIFIALLLFLNAVLFKPVLSHIEARKAALEGDQGVADSDIAERDRLNAEAKKVILEARKEATKIKEAILIEAKEKADAKIAAEQKKIAKELAAFEKTLAESEANLKNALLGEAPLIKERVKTKFIAA
jgi:F-type H+-transporting ATPase subunit b